MSAGGSDKDQVRLLKALISRLQNENNAKLKQNSVLLTELDRLSSQLANLRQHPNPLTPPNHQLELAHQQITSLQQHQQRYSQQINLLRTLLEQKASECSTLAQHLHQLSKDKQQIHNKLLQQHDEVLNFRERQFSTKSMPDDSQQKQYDTQIGKLTGQLEAIKSELIEKLADIASLEKDKEEIEERVKKQLVEVTEERDKVKEELAGVREQVKQQVRELQGQLKGKDDQIGKLKNEISELTPAEQSDTKVSEQIHNEVMMAQMSALKNMIQTLTQQAADDNSKLVKHLQVKTKQLEQIRQWSETIAIERDDLKKENFNLKSEVAQLQQKLNKVDEIKNGNSKFEAQLVELKAEYEQYRKKSEEQLVKAKEECEIASGLQKKEQDLMRDLKKVNQQLSEKYQELEAGYDNSNKQLLKLKSQNQNLNFELSELKQAYKKLQQQRQTFKKQALHLDISQSEVPAAIPQRSPKVNTDNIVSGASTYHKDVQTLAYNLSSLISVNLTLSNELSEVRKQKQKLEEQLAQATEKTKRSHIDVIMEENTPKLGADSPTSSEGRAMKGILGKMAKLQSENMQLNERISQLTLMNGYLLKKTTTLEMNKDKDTTTTKRFYTEANGQTQRIYNTVHPKPKKGDMNEALVGYSTTREKGKIHDKQRWINLQQRISSLKLQNENLKKSLGTKPQ